jgi:hypothetical protein
MRLQWIFRKKNVEKQVTTYLLLCFTIILWGWYLTPQVHAVPINRIVLIALVMSIAPTNFLSPIGALLAPILNLIPWAILLLIWSLIMWQVRSS